MLRLLFALLIFPGTYLAQVNFTEKVIDTSSSLIGISKVVTGDFNNDGSTDVATLRKTADELAFYLGNGASFGAKQILASSLNYPTDVCAADLNGDGFDDLTTVELAGKAVQVFINQNGNFNTGKKIDSNVFFAPIAIFSNDFTNDNIPDLLAVDDTVVYMYENDGNANFTRHKVAGETEFYSGGIADINGDSLPDVLLGSVKLYTYINNGDGTFTRDTRNESLINNFIFEIELADIDQDGDQDMAIYYSNTNPNIDWYSNDGTGKFTLAGSITTTANDVHSMRFADFNNDNYPDFVTGYGQTGDLVWVPNNNGTFGNEIILKTYNLFTYEVAVADADSDGDIDIFCGQHMDGLFLWENLSPHVGIGEIASVSSFYPNPSSGTIFIKNRLNVTLTVFDLAGNIVHQSQVSSNDQSLDLDLPGGTYILQFTDSQTTTSEKLIIR